MDKVTAIAWRILGGYMPGGTYSVILKLLAPAVQGGIMILWDVVMLVA